MNNIYRKTLTAFLISLLIFWGCINLPIIKIHSPGIAYICYGATLPKKMGTTYYFVRVSVVALNPENMPSRIRRLLITHELFHVLGYVTHIQADTPALFTEAFDEYTLNFTREEIALLKNVTLHHPIEISSEEGLEEETIWAINKINSVNNLFVWKKG